jgi:hypothetical protein
MQDEGGGVSKPTWKQIGPDKLLFLCQSHLKQLPTAQLRLPALFSTSCACHNKSRKMQKSTMSMLFRRPRLGQTPRMRPGKR